MALSYIEIEGGNRLSGNVKISGSKNAALPILCSSILTHGTLSLTHCPKLSDIQSMCELLEALGVKINRHDNDVTLDGSRVDKFLAPYDMVRKMRASILVLGPLLSRVGCARVSLPGGCAIGARPVDVHLMGLQLMGANIELKDGYIEASCKRLKGNRIPLSIPSVTGTKNLIMAASLAKGETEILNAAREPEVIDLVKCLKAMGAEIEGEGTSTILIQGKDELTSGSHQIMTDRLEAGTYIIASIMTKSELTLNGVNESDLSFMFSLLKQFNGLNFHFRNNELKIEGIQYEIPPLNITTEPYPGFPTDLQAQWMALMSLSSGTSFIKETIFENRFMHVPELNRLGSQISIQGNTAFIKGVSELKGAQVMATDLRASVSLVLAALVAKGITRINRIYHLDRGYENLEQKLSNCGACIKRVIH